MRGATIPWVRNSGTLCPLLGDVTSPTTAVPYGSMTFDLRILSTEKHWPVRRQHTMYTNKSSQCKGEVHSSPVNKNGGFVASQQWMRELKRFPSVSWFAHPCSRWRGTCLKHKALDHDLDGPDGGTYFKQQSAWLVWTALAKDWRRSFFTPWMFRLALIPFSLL